MGANHQSERRAVLDVGSNSVLLTVCERTNDGWRPVHEATAVTALGEGTKATGLLGERGMSASLAAIADFFAQAKSHGALPVAAATMAARIATNTPEFIDRAESQGTPVRVLSGEDEALLGFRSVASDPIFANEPRISIIDPGGHSTEVTTADQIEGQSDWKIGFKKSYSIGTLGLKSTLLPDEQLNSLDVLKAIVEIDQTIGMRYRPNEAGKAVVLGATGTNLVSIREKMLTWEPDRVHGAWLWYEEVSKAFGWMMEMTDAERAAIPGMEPGREKTVHLGALILERFLYALGAEGCAVSVRGWRHAILESDEWFAQLSAR